MYEYLNFQSLIIVFPLCNKLSANYTERRSTTHNASSLHQNIKIIDAIIYIKLKLSPKQLKKCLFTYLLIII